MIRIGPAGTSGLGNYEGVRRCKELNLQCMEVEFTYGVRMPIPEAKVVGELSKKLGIQLSVHAPYWINLNSDEKIKIRQSQKRIMDSCERGHYLGAEYIVFHAGFYGKKSPAETYEIIKKSIIEMNEIIDKNKWNVKLAPETTGKKSQFGDLDELLRLRREAKCELCVDFSHIQARDQKIDYDEVFGKLAPVKHVHSHFSGVEYGEKGERRHILTPTSEIKTLLKHVKKYKKDITIINESPDPFGDCMKTLEILKEKITMVEVMQLESKK